jgi:hypothetical protein
MAGKKSRSFYKKYPKRKDQRKPYFGYSLLRRADTGSDPDKNKQGCIDPSCRPGGDCPWCSKGRQYKNKRREPAPDE